MKILMTADPIGGVWRYALELCEALRPYGAQVLLATLGGEVSAQQRAELAPLPHVELRESRYRLEWMESPWQSLEEAAGWLLSLEHEFGPALIHLNHLVHGHLAWRAPVMVAGHSCVLSWWQAVHGETPAGWSRYRESVTRSLQAADLVVAPTRAMMSALYRHYGLLPRARVIPNGLDPRRFRARRKEPLILCAGRLWDAGKNIGALCGVASSLSWPIAVAGATQSPDGHTEPMPGVQSLGALDRAALGEWYGRASIYALPARYEPFGLTVLEAALSGCALVLGDIPSLREVWGEAARYVPPEDPAALRETLEDLIAHPERLRRFAAFAQAHARRYTARTLASAYHDAYLSLLAAKDDRTCASYSSTTH